VETLEQKSGLNSLLYLDAIIGLPCLILYGASEKSIFLAFVWVLLIFTLLVYGISYAIDRDFLRSEKHVREMKQLDILGEKGKEYTSEEIDVLPDVQATKSIGSPAKNTKSRRRKDV
jgi:uncharacterized membrane protein YeiB